MIINWKKENAGVLVIPIIKGQVIVSHATLLPGHNEIDDEEWEGMKEHLSIVQHISAGNLEEATERIAASSDEPVRRRRDGSDGTLSKKAEKLITKITKMSPQKARKIIEDTWVLPTLEKWISVEGRDEIRAVLHNQIEAINHPKINTQGSK